NMASRWARVPESTRTAVSKTFVPSFLMEMATRVLPSIARAPARAVRARRRPVDWRRYSKRAHVARAKLPRYEHPLLLTAALSLIFTILGIQVLQALGVGIGSGIRDLGVQLVGSLPKAQEGPLVIGEREVTISVAPIFEGI